MQKRRKKKKLNLLKAEQNGFFLELFAAPDKCEGVYKLREKKATTENIYVDHEFVPVNPSKSTRPVLQSRL